VFKKETSTTGKIDDVDYSYKVDYQYDINGNIINKSDVIICIVKHGFVVVFVTTLSRIVCHLLPMGCFLGCLISVFYQDFCMIIIFINYLIGQYFPFFTLSS
jgi:hypothetical protein